MSNHPEFQNNQSDQVQKMNLIPPPDTLQKPAKLPSVITLLKESLQFYKTRFALFLSLAFFPILILVGIFFLGALMVKLVPSSIFAFFLLLFLYALGVFLVYWGIVAMLCVVKAQEKISFRAALKESISKIVSFLWIGFLVNLVVIGGAVPLVIPGLVLGVALMLSIYVYIAEKKKGINALVRSSALTKGFRWAIFWRYLALALMILLFVLPLALLLSAIQEEETRKLANDILSSVVSLLTTPLVLIFGYLIYKKLAEFSPASQFQPSKKARHLYIFLAFWSIAAMILAYSFTFYSLFSS